MAINLKEILISDVDNIKLDKVNYNFDQLVANGGGPQGYQGPNGALGYQGVTGYQGYQGEIGYQGDQGPQGNNGQGIWKINPGGSGTFTDTILPIHDPVNSQAPSVIIGYKTTDPEWDLAYIEQDSQLVINRHDNFSKNLELRSSGLDSSFSFILSSPAANESVLDMRFDNLTGIGSLNQYGDVFTWNHGTNNVPLMTLDGTELNVEVDSKFKDVTVEGSLKINPGTTIDVTDYIAVSGDDSGTVTFKSIADIGGVVPIGTMVSMIPSQFEDDTKFINEQLNVQSPTTHPLHIEIGKGIGAHTGWYLCNGKTWTNGTVSFPTPDLNSFSYTIDNDPNVSTAPSQGEASVTNTEISIIGGADTSMTADYNDINQEFDIVGTVTPGTTTFQSASGTTYTIKRLPQIIFLGVPDLYWTDAGTNAEDLIPSMEFNDWWEESGNNASVSASSSGAITLNKGNNTSSIYYPTVASASSATITSNADPGSRTITDIVVTMTVPPGHGNSGQTLTRTFTATQPTSYTAPVVTTRVTWNITNNITGTDLELYKQYDSPIINTKTTTTTNSSTSTFVYLKAAEGYDLVEDTAWSDAVTSGSVGSNLYSSNTQPTISTVEEYRLLQLSASGLNGTNRTGSVTLSGSARLKNTWQLREVVTGGTATLTTATRTLNDGFSIGDEVELVGSGNVGTCYEIIDMIYSANQQDTISSLCIGAPVAPPPATVPNGSFSRFGSPVEQGTVEPNEAIEVQITSNVPWIITKSSGSATSSVNSGASGNSNTTLTGGASGFTDFNLVANTNDQYHNSVMDTFKLITEEGAEAYFRNAEVSGYPDISSKTINPGDSAHVYVTSNVNWKLGVSTAGMVTFDGAGVNESPKTDADEYEISIIANSGAEGSVQVQIIDNATNAVLDTLAINIPGTPTLTYSQGTRPDNTETNLNPSIVNEKDANSTYNIGNFEIYADSGYYFTDIPTISLPAGLSNTFASGAINDDDGNMTGYYWHVTHTNTPSTDTTYTVTFSGNTEEIPGPPPILTYSQGTFPSNTTTNLSTSIVNQKDAGSTYNIGNFEIYANDGYYFTDIPSITLPVGLTNTFASGAINDDDGNMTGYYWHVTHTNTPSTDRTYSISFSGNVEEIPVAPDPVYIQSIGIFGSSLVNSYESRNYDIVYTFSDGTTYNTGVSGAYPQSGLTVTWLANGSTNGQGAWHLSNTDAAGATLQYNSGNNNSSIELELSIYTPNNTGGVQTHNTSITVNGPSGSTTGGDDSSLGGIGGQI